MAKQLRTHDYHVHLPWVLTDVNGLFGMSVQTHQIKRVAFLKICTRSVALCTATRNVSTDLSE